MSYQVVSRLSDAATLWRYSPFLSLSDLSATLTTRRFKRWVRRNRKTLGALMAFAPAVAFKIFRADTVMAMAHASGPAAKAAAATGAFGFFTGQGIILLHVLIVGFLTLVVTTFLKFTGRGDLAPLVVFIGGGVILLETIGLFNDIYHAVATFLTA